MTSTNLQLLEQCVAAATAAMVEQGAIDQETSIAVWATSGNKAAERGLYGSIIECVDPTSQYITYYSTATSGDLVTGVNNQEKLTLQKNNGSGATTKKTGAELATMGIRRIAQGVLTIGQHAGACAPSITIGGLPATLSPIASDPFKQLAVAINDSDAQTMDIGDAFPAAGIVWRMWSGKRGGAEATPEGAGLVAIATANALVAPEATIQGTQLGAALVGAALRTMGVTDAAGNCATGELGSFIAAWAGQPRSKDIVSIALAEAADSAPRAGGTAQRAAAKAAGEAIIAATRVALVEIISHATAVAEKGKRLTDTGLTLHAALIGAYARAAYLDERRVDEVIANAHAARVPAPVPAPADAATVLAQARAAQAARMAAGLKDPVVALAVRTAMIKLLEQEGWKPETANAPPPPHPAGPLGAVGGSAGGGAVDGAAGGAAGETGAGALGGAAGAGGMGGLIGEASLAELRPAGAEGLSTAEVLGELAKALPARSSGAPTSAADVIDALGEAVGAKATSGLFGGNAGAAAEQAAEDFETLVRNSDAVFEGVVGNWAEAVFRLEKVMLAHARSRSPAEVAGPPPARGGRRGESALRSKVDKASVSEAARACSAGVIAPLFEEQLVLLESRAPVEAGALQEAARLVGNTDIYSGVAAGYAAHGYLFSNGRATGSLPAKGEAATTAIAARESLLLFITMAIENIITRKRAHERAADVAKLATCILVLDLELELIVVILGGIRPEDDESGTERDMQFAGTWGSLDETQAKTDMPLAFDRLGSILGAVHSTAGGAPMSASKPGFGIGDKARQATARLSPEKYKELFADFFRRVKYAAHARRTRLNQPLVDIEKELNDTFAAKYNPLIAEQRVERTTLRCMAEGAPRAPSPKRERDGEAAAEQKQLSAKERRTRGMPSATKEAKLAAAAAANAAANATAASAAAAALGDHPPPPKEKKDARGGSRTPPSFAPNSISKMVDKVDHMGAVEAVDFLIIKAHGAAAERLECRPCGFIVLTGTCRSATNNSIKCLNCAAHALTSPPGKDVLSVPAGTVAKVKAACTARLASDITAAAA